jgi:predicted class III extradiol MEMO1 family dioxygenase
MATDIRPTAVAGTWYPASADGLSREVDDYVGRAQVDEPDAAVAIVAPHAGLKYSGPVAAFAYRAVQHGRYAAAVLVGPSHFIGFNGVSIWPRGAWNTPFGPVPVAEDLARAIVAASGEIVEHPLAHGREHSLEMQLPFVAHMLPAVPIVPMVMGYQNRETAFALGEALASAVAAHTGKGSSVFAEAAADKSGPPEHPPARVLLVASSDLSHYQDAETARTMDEMVLRNVEQLDAEGLMQALEREPHHACGGGPMVAVLHAAKRLGAIRARVLKYGDSGDVSGDKSSVVGYMAAAIW